MSQVDPASIIVFDPPASLSRPAAPRGILAVKILVSQRYADGLTLKDLAAAASMPTNTLTRHFNRVYGVSPMRWLWAFRTLLAGEIIATSPGWTLTEVATHCGFNSSAHFSRRYREMFQDSPSHHRLIARDRDRGREPTGGTRVDVDPLLGPDLELVRRTLARLDAMAHQI